MIGTLNMNFQNIRIQTITSQNEYNYVSTETVTVQTLNVCTHYDELVNASQF